MLRIEAKLLSFRRPGITADTGSIPRLDAAVQTCHSAYGKMQHITVTPVPYSPSASVRAIFIQDLSDAELLSLSNFITLDNRYIITADGQIFYVKD